MNRTLEISRAYLLRTVAAGIRATWITLATMLGFLALVETVEIERAPYLTVVAVATAGTLGVGLLDWGDLFDKGKALFYLLVWSMLDIVLISVALAATGGQSSPLFILYAMTTVFFCTSYPPRSQALLWAFTCVCFLAVVTIQHGPVDEGLLLGRLGSLGALTFLTGFLSRELIHRNLELAEEVEQHLSSKALLLEKTEQLREAQRLARLGSWEWEIATNVVSWSDELYEIYGIDPTDFVPSYEGFVERVHPDDRETVTQAVGRAYSEHEPFEFEHRIVRPDGTERTLAARGEVVIGPDGRAIRMRGTGQDITEELEHRETRLKLEEMARMQHEALEINDLVVQGLVVAQYSLEVGKPDMAQGAIRRSLAAARALVADLLKRAKVEPGDLVRKEPAHLSTARRDPE